MPKRDRAVEQRQVEPEQQLQDQRHRPEDPDVGPADRAQQRIRREPHQREHRAEHEADARCRARSAAGSARRRAGSTVRTGTARRSPSPTPGWSTSALQRHREQHRDDGGRHPAPRVPGRNHVSRSSRILGRRPRSGRSGRSRLRCQELRSWSAAGLPSRTGACRSAPAAGSGRTAGCSRWPGTAPLASGCRGPVVR